MFISLPDAVMHVIHRLNSAGFEAYAVGGCVRDSLLGKIPMDWDVTTSALPEETQAVFSEFRTIETGMQHGTVTVIVDDTPIEITTYRIDGTYSDGRHPDSVAFTRSLAEDLRRRDFTINAMAYHPVKGLVDLHDGRMDLERRVIRCVGVAQQRFTEDALRMLRAMRFASVLGYSIEAETDEALRKLAPTLDRVAVERISTELGKLLCGRDVNRILGEYADVLAVVIPEIVCDAHLCALPPCPTNLHTRWAALFYATNADEHVAVAVLRRLRMDTCTIDRVAALLLCKDLPIHTDAELLRLLNRLDAELIFDCLSLRNADEAIADRVRYLLKHETCYKLSMLDIRGQDILGLGVAVGPDVGKMLQFLLEAVMDGRCANRKKDLLEYANQWKKPVQ